MCALFSHTESKYSKEKLTKDKAVICRAFALTSDDGPAIFRTISHFICCILKATLSMQEINAKLFTDGLVVSFLQIYHFFFNLLFKRAQELAHVASRSNYEMSRCRLTRVQNALLV